MYKWLYKSITAVHSRLDKIIKAAEKEPDTDTSPIEAYHSLSPINDADVGHYVEVLTWALDHRKSKSIYNIALAGPYGSGKSSILKTFKDQNANDAYQFLEISLATFKEEPVSDSDQTTGSEDGDGQSIDTFKGDKDKNSKSNEDILRLIELSILQQIFYHEEDDKIPDSRFKKIRSFNKRTMQWITACVVTAIIFGINLFFPESMEKILVVNLSVTFALFLHWVSLFVFLIALCLVVYRSIRLAYSLRISKFKFHEAEIEIDKGISKSILNNHLDEILYFFEVTDYSVVLIEDLDRFRQAEIFTKLRELNLLINNSKKIKQEVVFVYAVRDEMFWNKDRTKFFDFIIPVIPVINSSNSNEKLAKIVEDNNYKISAQLIDDISLFIDDMRLLYNITNEYGIYHTILGAGLTPDKLLAMIVYKNIYPDDFVLLGDGKGKLYNLLNKKTEYIKNAVKEIDKEIAAKKGAVKDLQSVMLEDADELRIIYLSHFASENKGFVNFQINGTPYNIVEASEESIFEYFKKGEFSFQYYYSSYGSHYLANGDISSFKFDKLSKSVDSENSYDERLNQIISIADGREESLKNEIQRLEQRKATIRHFKIQEILADRTNQIDIDTSGKQGKILSILIRSGYINEDYLDYISLFYEGSISKDDRTFLLNVKSQQNSEYDTKLVKVENLVRRISVRDFQESYVLNYNILDFLLTNGEHETKLDGLMLQLHDNNDYGTAFIDGFIANGTNVEMFIKLLLKHWPGFWKYVDEQSSLTNQAKEEYFKILLNNAEVADLKSAMDLSKLRQSISDRKDFLSIIPNAEKLKSIIKTLKILFTDVDLELDRNGLSDFVYKGNYYKINSSMLSKVIKYAGNFNFPSFEKENYDAILKSNVPELIFYIENNIEIYVNNVHCALPNNTKEPEASLLKLYNNEKLDLSTRKNLIMRTGTVIADLSQVTSDDLLDLLLEDDKVAATWENMIEYFSRRKIFEGALATFLNDNNNTQLLSETVSEKLKADTEIKKEFITAFLKEASIDNEVYRLLIEELPEYWKYEDVDGISDEKMLILIEGNAMDLNIENYDGLREHHQDLHLTLLEHKAGDYVKDIDSYETDALEIAYLLKSTYFNPSQKLAIINNSDQDVIIANSAIKTEIGNLILAHPAFAVSKEVLIAVLKQNRAVHDRIKLYNIHYKTFNNVEAIGVFSTFPKPYNDIGVLHQTVMLDYTEENRFLENNLKERLIVSSSKHEPKGIKLSNYRKAK